MEEVRKKVLVRVGMWEERASVVCVTVRKGKIGGILS